MKPPVIQINLENIILSAAKNCKIITINLAEASDYDIKAAKQLKVGNYEKASYYASLAKEHLHLASNAKIEDLKLHSQYN